MTRKKVANTLKTDEKGVGVEVATKTVANVKEAHAKSKGGQSTRKRIRHGRTKKKNDQQQKVERVEFCQEIGRTKTEDSSLHDKEEAAFTLECEICCSTDISTDQITTCSLGHIFCKSCARQMTETQLGMSRSNLPCMAMEVSSGHKIG